MAAATWVLALDIGQRKTGVAVGQTLTQTARPLTVIYRSVETLHAQAFAAWIKEWSVTVVVIGMPTLRDGSQHPLYPHIRRIADEIRRQSDIPVYFVDEYLSSHEARIRAPKVQHIDAFAAVVIAEDWLASTTQAE